MMKRSTHEMTGATTTAAPATPAKATEVQRLFDQLARALTVGDGWRVARLWDTPAFVVGANMVKPVGTADEVATFFGSAKAEYNKRGISDTRAEIKRLDWVSDGLVIADVRWPYLDGRGHEIGGESSTYTLRRHETGELKICVVVMRGEEQ